MTDYSNSLIFELFITALFVAALCFFFNTPSWLISPP